MRLFIVRHGLSRSNEDWTENQRTADHAIELSPTGHRQAQECGEFLNDYLHERYVTNGVEFFVPRIRLWQSPYTRTRQTAEHIWRASQLKQPTRFLELRLRGGDSADYLKWEHRPEGAPLLYDRKENLHLFEQQFGIFDGLSDEERELRYPVEHAYYEKCKKFEGKLWPKMPLGESRMDVALRVHQAFGTFHRDAKKHAIEDLVIVTHGTTARAIVMMWLHLPYEWMNSEPNPNNCSVRLIENGADKGFIFKGFSVDPPTPSTPNKEAEE